MKAALAIAALAAAAAVTAQSPAPSAPAQTITVPATVDTSKPDSVKAYASAVFAKYDAVQPAVVQYIPTDKADAFKKAAALHTQGIKNDLATATDPAQLAKDASAIATVDAAVSAAQANPTAFASSAVAALASAASASASASNAAGAGAAVEVPVAAARLAAAAAAGAIALAAFF